MIEGMINLLLIALQVVGLIGLIIGIILLVGFFVCAAIYCFIGWREDVSEKLLRIRRNKDRGV